MSHEDISPTSAIINGLTNLLNSDENLSLNFMTEDIELTNLDRPVVKIIPISRTIEAGGSRGMGGQGVEHRYINKLIVAIGLFFPVIDQDAKDKETWIYEDRIENLIIDNQEKPLDELPEGIEWIQMQVVDIDHRPIEDDVLMLDQLIFQVMISYAKIRQTLVVNA